MPEDNLSLTRSCRESATPRNNENKEITQESSRISDSASWLAVTISRLEERLSMILSHDEHDNERVSDEDIPIRHTELGARLQSHDGTIRYQIGKLQRIIDRIEL